MRRLSAILKEYCVKNYPAYTFKALQLSQSNEIEEFKVLDNQNKIELIVVPTPHKIYLPGCFNPSLAHKLLFHSDIPMLSIPVWKPQNLIAEVS